MGYLDKPKPAESTAFDLDAKDQTVSGLKVDDSLFPFEGFEFEDIQENANPNLTLKSPWDYVIEHDLNVQNDLDVDGELNVDGSTQVDVDLNVDRNTTLGSLFWDFKRVLNANYTILDNDGCTLAFVTTGASDRTITLPTLADNQGRVLRIIKIDSGAGSVIVDGEGAETINGTATWEITEEHGYIDIACGISEWSVFSQWGCIYEMWDTSDYALTTSWVDYYNLAGIVPGKYLIEFGVALFVAAAGNAKTFATLATAVDTEDDQKYTVGLWTISGQSFCLFQTKSFHRTFAGATTLYLNAKEVALDGLIYHSSMGIKGYIRATRVG